ncbi:uncharacterized protein [Gossypium hirsutum]|uniref:Tf2-1-like SH3-like domain-containing protein n=1 Tax=Gossypium hirsutum TaxID=3635 RepID=A0A1U8KNS5_GOSHI|nr:uncharacterized protein LOC107919099 [Gossypium hirsutum]
MEDKVSPSTKVLRFGQKGKLSPRLIGPYQVIERIGPVAYHLQFLPKLERIHDAFHVSMLRKYQSDPSHVVSVEEIEVQSNLTYDEELVEILAHKDKVLRNKTILLVKVLWRNHKTKEATWEIEDVMRHQYPYLLDSGQNFEDEISF